MSTVDEVKERIDIVEVVGETVKLRKSGKNYTGFCPFHPNTRTPAFVVFPETGTWRCFGACNEGGDVFRFVMKREGWDFPEALNRLAQRAGVELRPITPQTAEAEAAHQRLRDLLEAAAGYYRHSLLETPGGQGVLAYLRRRRLGDAILEAFQIGWSPDSWDATQTFLTERGFSSDDMRDAGLISERESGGRIDRFRNRIMFPVRDGRGRLCGFGARIVDPNDVPKFLNSPQTPVFDKGRLLYGLDRARRAIRQADRVAIVEGYLDVIALHQAGYENTVSPMGTALTEDQLRLLKRTTRRMVLALDPDAAGIRAAMRGLDLARQTLDREADPVLDPRGFIRYEGRLDAEIRVVGLPDGKDPDEIVADDPQAWAPIVDGASPIIEFVMDELTREADLDDPKVKAAIARRVVPMIGDVADPVEREAYRQSVARRLKVDERALQEAASAGPRPRRRTEAASAESAARRTESPQFERFTLGLLLRRPELLYRIDRRFSALGLDRLSAEDFHGTDGQELFEAVRASLAQDDVDPARHWHEALPDGLLEQAEALAEVPGAVDAGEPRVQLEAERHALRLRRGHLESALMDLRYRLLNAQEEGSPEDEVRRLIHEVQRIGERKNLLDRALAGEEAPRPDDAGDAWMLA